MNRTVRPELLAADHLRALLEPFTTSVREPNWAPVPVVMRPPYSRADRRGWVLLPGDRAHTVTHPGLLDQLARTVTGSTTGDDSVRPAPGSKPAARLDTLALLERIEKQSAAMAAEHGIPPLPLRARLSRLSGVIGHTTNQRVKAWATTARVLTQHDGPPFSPNVPCPQETCERWGTIRVRFDERVAVCTECGHVWAEDEHGSFQMLARWVEWADQHLHGPRHWTTDPDITGYDETLRYQVECTVCATERYERAVREAARLRQARSYSDRPHRHAHAS